MESLPTDVWPLFLQGEMFVVQRIQHGLTSSSNQHLCGMGRIVKVAYDKAIALLTNSLHSRSPLVRNLTNMINELSMDPTHHLEKSNTRIQSDNSDRMKSWGRQYQCIDKVDPSGYFATVEHWLLHLWMSRMLYKLAMLVWKPMKTNYLRVSIIK